MGPSKQNMGRRGGSARPAPSRGMSTAPPARPPPPRAPAPPPAQRAAAAAPGHPAPAQPSMMGQMAGNVASVAAGSVIGHGISNMMFGSSSHQAAPQEQAPAQSAYAAPSQGADACKFEFENFMQCLQQNNNDANQCQYFQDTLTQCRYNAGM